MHARAQGFALYKLIALETPLYSLLRYLELRNRKPACTIELLMLRLEAEKLFRSRKIVAKALNAMEIDSLRRIFAQVKEQRHTLSRERALPQKKRRGTKEEVIRIIPAS